MERIFDILDIRHQVFYGSVQGNSMKFIVPRLINVIVQLNIEHIVSEWLVKGQILI